MNRQGICRVLTGPTASGKSEIAMRLASENGWDILCMDSMQVYRRMDIGTAKPTKEDRRTVPHHLLDLCEPDETFSVARYTEEAGETVRRLLDEGRDVLFTGGTGLYLESLVKPMGLGNVPADESLRAELREIAGRPDGAERLDRLLRESDPVTADRLPMNDIRRRIRAIEVYKKTGIPFSAQENRREPSPYRWIIVCICPEREKLYERINSRTEKMISQGLPDEVASLLKEGVPENAQSMQAIGYKEMIPYLSGKCTLPETSELIRKRTRHYAKRQITFLKRIENIQYVDPLKKGAYEEIKNRMKENA